MSYQRTLGSSHRELNSMNDSMVHGLSRRALMRNGLVTAIGAIVAVAALPEFTGSALASDPDNYMQIITTANFSNYHCQSNWWYCIKCSGINHSGNNTAGGVCPA